MVDLNLFTVFAGTRIFFIIAFLLFFILGFFIKAAKKILWLLAIIALLAAIYFVFR